MSYRPEWWLKSGNGGTVGLLEMAELLHMQTSGACPDLNDKQRGQIIACLSWADDNWSPSTHPKHAAYDNAVRMLVKQALIEAGSLHTT